MKRFGFLALTAIAAMGMAALAPSAQAQVSINVQIGQPPVCPYGYYDYAPYNCAPFGYYSPAWFTGGVFIGAGPWFAGPVGFHGWVDRHYDPHYGYRGIFPHRGERPDWARHRGWEGRFHGDYERAEYRHLTRSSARWAFPPASRWWKKTRSLWPKRPWTKRKPKACACCCPWTMC